MVKLGTIKEIETNEDQILAIVDLGNGDQKTCIIYGGAGSLGYPQAGDQCVCVNVGGEFIVTAVFTADSTLENGNVLFFGRDSGGAQVSKITLKNDSSIKLENSAGFISIDDAGQVNINDNFTVDATPAEP